MTQQIFFVSFRLTISKTTLASYGWFRDDSGGGFQVVFSSPDKAVTAGQFVAIYWNDEIVFSGAIA